MSKPVMVSIGKAGQDTFLQGEVFRPFKEKGVFYEHIKLGEKFYVEEAVSSPGNNALNASITFARQHLDVQFRSVVGNDPAGQAILLALDNEHVDTSRMVVDEAVRTSFSTILLAPTGERTVLDYPGTAKLRAEQLKLDQLDCDWLYVSSVGSMPLLKKIIKTVHQKSIKIAFNPASFELKHLKECAELFQYVTVLALNKEEAQLFVEGSTPKALAKKLVESVSHVVVSDGPRGAVASDGLQLVTAGMYEDVPVIDRTGAGDAFTSGFVVQIAQGKTLAEAMIFASANSTSVVSKIGANAGILKGTPKLHDMPILVEPL